MITASVVLYNTGLDYINNLISQFSMECVDKIFIVDNSKENSREFLFPTDKYIYIHNPSNPGFGASHNIALKKSTEFESDFHFIINPDIMYEEPVFNQLIGKMARYEKIGIMMPLILNMDGTNQFLCKEYPSPLLMILRRLTFFKKMFSHLLSKYELRDLEFNTDMIVPLVSGCFMLIRGDLIKSGLRFDENFFMYFEDYDLCRLVRRLNYEVMVASQVKVKHGYAKGSARDVRLLFFHIKSSFVYFMKWGFVFDKERSVLNSRINLLSKTKSVLK